MQLNILLCAGPPHSQVVVVVYTADGDCSHEIKRRLFLGRKVMTNLDSIFKSRDITLPTKVRLVKVKWTGNERKKKRKKILIIEKSFQNILRRQVKGTNILEHSYNVQNSE